MTLTTVEEYAVRGMLIDGKTKKEVLAALGKGPRSTAIDYLLTNQNETDAGKIKKQAAFLLTEQGVDLRNALVLVNKHFKKKEKYGEMYGEAQDLADTILDMAGDTLSLFSSNGGAISMTVAASNKDAVTETVQGEFSNSDVFSFTPKNL